MAHGDVNVLLPIDVAGTDSTSSDLEVLLLFRRNTNKEFWSNRHGWDANCPDLNSWFGVTATENGRVVKLELSTQDFPKLRGEIKLYNNYSSLHV